jgi:hypothetical protein
MLKGPGGIREGREPIVERICASKECGEEESRALFAIACVRLAPRSGSNYVSSLMRPTRHYVSEARVPSPPGGDGKLSKVPRLLRWSRLYLQIEL